MPRDSLFGYSISYGVVGRRFELELLAAGSFCTEFRMTFTKARDSQSNLATVWSPHRHASHRAFEIRSEFLVLIDCLDNQTVSLLSI